MKFNKFAVIVIAVAAMTLSCSSRRVKFDPETATVSNEKSGAGLSASITWLKNKGDTIDIMMSLKNKYDKDIVFKKTAWKLMVGNREGLVRKLDFSGEMDAGATEKGLVIFEFDEKLPRKGSATLIIEPIKYDNEAQAKNAIPPLKLELPLND